MNEEQSKILILYSIQYNKTNKTFQKCAIYDIISNKFDFLSEINEALVNHNTFSNPFHLIVKEMKNELEISEAHYITIEPNKTIKDLFIQDSSNIKNKNSSITFVCLAKYLCLSVSDIIICRNSYLYIK